MSKRDRYAVRHPQTGEESKIAAANVPACVSGKALKDAVK
ncbi:HU family DNA-binding protein [Klebsiella pneumoniae]|nr:HU family DNA-binding protein [Klebsiella pneumoniae]MDP0641168.1 HU family DNA-binding protein [Klebsiella pneumoniae]